MELRFYDPTMNLIGIMENQRSLVWTRRYFEPGQIELHTPITQENLILTAIGNIIWKKGSAECAVIEDRTIEERWELNTITVKGRMLSSYMDRRLIRPTVTFRGKTEVAMRKLLQDAYPIPLVELGEMQGFDDTVSFQATYKNLLQYESKLARSANIGFRFRPDFTDKKIYFETYRGVERTTSQGVNNRVIFSESYNNLNDFVYRENNQLYKNVIYVGGTGDGTERVFVQIGDEDGLERREVFIDARDLSDTDMTADEYKALLIQRGIEKQSEYQMSESIECNTGADINYHYLTNYDLGDVVTVRKKSFGITADLRITEIQEIYERGIMKVAPVFGTPLKETIDWSDD